MCVCIYIKMPHLSLRVRSEPWKSAIATQLSHFSIQLMGKDNCERHTLLSLISGISKHQALPRNRHVEKSRFPVGRSPKRHITIDRHVDSEYWPDPQLQCPPRCDQCEHPEQCQETAAPRPQAHCRSCSQSLCRRHTADLKTTDNRLKRTSLQIKLMPHLCRSHRIQFAWWCHGQLSDSPPWHVRSPHQPTGSCPSWQQSLCKDIKMKQNQRIQYTNVNTNIWNICLTTGNFGIGILLQMSVQNSITDLITDLV